MIVLDKTQSRQTHSTIGFQSFLGELTLFFIDKKINLLPNVRLVSTSSPSSFILHGPLGSLPLQPIHPLQLRVTRSRLILLTPSLKGFHRLNLAQTLIKQKMKGVTQGFKLNLILKGLGYRFLMDSTSLQLKIGFSHRISIPFPSKISLVSQTNQQIVLKSIDWIALTQFVHFIKQLKKPEPYKGKGFLLKNEQPLRKEGKKK